MTKKRAPILPRTTTARARRESVVISGTCQVGERQAEDVLVTDLGATGCKLQANWVGVTKAEPVQLWLGDFGPVEAKLKWIRKGSLGLAFNDPLEEAVLQPMLEAPTS